ncbi:MAG: tRNA 4-thiouridine(8) synthase ThiI [Acidimicrobiia bacterium]|nr:MAG: tRNA 4-thiouridine(8) synthase ThiI [Acidimicrobiia bacterium]
MPTLDAHPTLHVTLSGDVFLKSRRTQQQLIKRARANLDEALAKAGYGGPVARIGTHRFSLSPEQESLPAVRAAALTVFGIGSVDAVVEQAFVTFDELAAVIAAHSAERVTGHTFAARVKRRGTHTWTSVDLARAIGSFLVEAGGTVDLTNPEVSVDVTVLDDRAFIVIDHRKGSGGLPIGTQDRVLCLISGGFDSVVAAWMLMSRGCTVDFVHFSLNCAQSDHALAVARELWGTWGHGMKPTVHLVEFQPVKDALYEHVDSRMRQVTLKVMMAKAASEIAEADGISALVTGDAMGQVSSQTLPHLVAVSRAVDTPILRPLLGLPKESIIDLARRVGTAELSARAREVCDLSEGGPVATSASTRAVDTTVTAIPEHVLTDVVSTAKVFSLADWTPGQL